MSDESSLAYQQAKAAYLKAQQEAVVTGQNPGTVDSIPLLTAARGHAAAAEAEGRLMETVAAEYEAQLAILGAGGEPDREVLAALGQELGTLRLAIANTEGNLPSGGHSVGVSI